MIRTLVIAALFATSVACESSAKLGVTIVGQGTVQSQPDGIDCGLQCTAEFNEGTDITLTAAPEAGWSFTRWMGDCSGSDVCALAMARGRSVTAEFTEIPVNTISVGILGSGGTVSSSPAGVACPPTCTVDFPVGLPLQLSASATTGLFHGWYGDCSGLACSPLMTDDRHVYSAFGATNGGGWWGGGFGNSASQWIHDVAIDGIGNVVLVGAFTGTITFGSTVLDNGAGSGAHAFVAKVAPDGRPIWAQSYGSPGSSFSVEALSVEVLDAAGSVGVAGYFSDTVDFGTGSISATGNTNHSFLLSLSGDGFAQWVRTAGGASGDTRANDIAVSPSGDVAITGFNEADVNFGGLDFVATGKNFFIAMYTGDNTHLISRSFLSGVDAEGTALAFKSNGHMVAAGHWAGVMNFGVIGNDYPAIGDRDAFLVTFQGSPVGAPSYQYGGANAFTVPMDVAVLSDDSVVVAGQITGVVDFGGGNLGAGGLPYQFMLKTDVNGPHDWSRDVSGAGQVAYPFMGVAVDSNDSIVFSGGMLGTSDFGGGNVTSQNTDGFIAEYASDGTYQWARFFVGTGHEHLTGIALDGNGAIAVGGWCGSSTASYDTVTITTNGMSDAVVLRAGR